MSCRLGSVRCCGSAKSSGVVLHMHLFGPRVLHTETVQCFYSAFIVLQYFKIMRAIAAQQIDERTLERKRRRSATEARHDHLEKGLPVV